MDQQRYVGVVKWFDGDKGYGFIQREGQKDLFVHYSGIRGGGFRSLQEGQEVEFSIGPGRKGEQAIEVQIIG